MSLRCWCKHSLTFFSLIPPYQNIKGEFSAGELIPPNQLMKHRVLNFQWWWWSVRSNNQAGNQIEHNYPGHETRQSGFAPALLIIVEDNHDWRDRGHCCNAHGCCSRQTGSPAWAQGLTFAGSRLCNSRMKGDSMSLFKEAFCLRRYGVLLILPRYDRKQISLLPRDLLRSWVWRNKKHFSLLLKTRGYNYLCQDVIVNDLFPAAWEPTLVNRPLKSTHCCSQ